jgi:sarcosine oxidase subunit beta
VLALFPQLKNVRIVRTWAGIEGFTPDSLPIIGPSLQAAGLFHCFGFSAHGFQLSPIVGEIMSELVVDGHTNHPIEPFTINRFL